MSTDSDRQQSLDDPKARRPPGRENAPPEVKGSPPIELLSNESIRPKQKIGDFEIVREIGRGGMGIVYEARQVSLDKQVALKVLPFHGVLDKRVLKRFQNEAWAAAQLQHRHIVPVHHVGHEGGVYFYAMQYISGGDLSGLYYALLQASHRSRQHPKPNGDTPRDRGPDHPTPKSPPSPVAIEPGPETSHEDPDATRKEVPDRRDATPRSNGSARSDSFGSNRMLALLSKSGVPSVRGYWDSLVGMGIQAAEALDYAHEMGIVHRDIKPSNLLLDDSGDVWVADFGLARIQSDPGMTATGAIIGTLRYMSPEQAMGKRVGVDHRTDIYSLGVTLYELLTLHRAFAGDSRERIIRQVAFEEPLAPRKINRRIPAELETIVLKAMSKNPVDRYQTAGDLADDLRRFRDKQPIRGRKPTIVQRLGRWSQRNRSLVVSAAALGVAAMIGSIAVALVLWNYSVATAAALQTERTQRAAVDRLLMQRDGLRLAANSALVRDQDPTLATLLGIEAARRHPGIDANDSILRSLEASHEVRTLAEPTVPVGHVAYSADGSRLITSNRDAGAAGTSSPALVWQTETGELLGQLESPDQSITSACFSPDRFRVLTAFATSADDNGRPDGRTDGRTDGPKTVEPEPCTWDMTTFGKLTTFSGARLKAAHRAAFNDDGLRVVFPAKDNSAAIYDAVAGHELKTLTGHSAPVVFAAFSPQGDRVVTLSHDNTLRLWDADSAETLLTIEHWKERSPGSSECVVSSVAFRQDGKQIVTASSKLGIHLWDLATGKQVNSQHIPGNAADYWPDGQFVLTRHTQGSQFDQRDCQSGDLIQSFQAPDETIADAVISPDGLWVATTGGPDAAAISIWESATGERKAILRGHQRIVQYVAFAPDSLQLASASADTTAKLWHVRDASEQAQYETPPAVLAPITVPSPDGKTLAIVSRNAMRVNRWMRLDDPSGAREQLGRLWAEPKSNARFLSTHGGRMTVHSLQDGEEVSSRNGTGETIRFAAISADGTTVAAYSTVGSVSVWWPDQQRQTTLRVGPNRVLGLAFSPNGEHLLVLGSDGTTQVWVPETSSLLHSLQHEGKAINVRYRHDGKQLAVVTDQNRAALWDGVTFERVATLHDPTASFTHAEFTHGGEHLLTYREVQGKQVQVWNLIEQQLEERLPATGVVQVKPHPELEEALVTSGEGAKLWRYDENTTVPLTDLKARCGGYSIDGSEIVVSVGGDPMADPRSDLARARLLRWDRATLQSAAPIPLQVREAAKIVSTANGAMLLESDSQIGLVLHERTSHQVVATIAAHAKTITQCRFTPDSHRVVTASEDRSVALWENPTGKLVHRAWGHKAAVTALAVSTDNRRLLSGDADGETICWDIDSGQEVFRITLEPNRVRHLSFHPDRRLAMIQYADGTIRLHDCDANEQVELGMDGETYRWAEFSPGGTSLLSVPLPKKVDAAAPGGDRIAPGGEEASSIYPIYVVPLDGGAKKLIAHQSPVTVAHFCDDGKRILSVTQSGRVTVRDIDAAKIVSDHTRPGFIVRSAAVSPSNVYVAVASPNTVTIWKRDQPDPWITVPNMAQGNLPMLDWSPFSELPGNRFLTRGFKTLRFRDWPLEPAAAAENGAARKLTDLERVKYLVDLEPEEPDEPNL